MFFGFPLMPDTITGILRETELNMAIANEKKYLRVLHVWRSIKALAAMLLCMLSVIGSVNFAVAGGNISTFAGGGPGNGDSALLTSFGPSCVVADPNGNLLVCSSDRILKVSSNGIVTVVAGNGTHGLSGDNGPAKSAMLYNPRAMTVDSIGNTYIADSSNNRIRKVDVNGVITTFAGTGHFQFSGYSGDNGPAVLAQLNNPQGIAVDASGNVYISDSANNCIRKVSVNGIITSIAGMGLFCNGNNGTATQTTLNNPRGLAIDAAGNLFIAEGSGVRKLTPNGIISTVNSAALGIPGSVAVDANGNLYAADFLRQQIFKLMPDGTSLAVAGTGVIGYSGDNGPATSAAFFNPFGISVDAIGNLYIADSGNYRVRMLSTSGIISTVAGNGKVALSGDNGPATSAQLLNPNGVTLDAGGNLYIADTWNNVIRKVTSNGIISTIAGFATGGSGANGFVGQNGYGGDNGPANLARLSGPVSVAVDSAGVIYFTDQGNHCIRKVGLSGIINAVAGICGTYGNSYFGDNGPATAAALNLPGGIAFDMGGNLYIADSGNNRVRKVGVNGVITTVAGNGVSAFNGDNGLAITAQLNPQGVAIDASGNLYIADGGNHRVRRVGVNGIITTVAGNGVAGYSGDNGPAISAQLNGPVSVKLDSSGNLYIADYYNERIRRVGIDGVITTVAGNGVFPSGFTGDGLSAISTQLYGPADVAIDTAGNLYIADVYNQRIRKVSASGAIDFSSGWNLLGNSVNLPITVATTFGNAANVATVWKWVPATSRWAFYTPTLTDGGAAYALSKGYDFLTVINGGEGFWVNAKVTFSSPLTAGAAISSSAFADKQIPPNSLPPGWSLISTGDNPSPRNFANAIALTPPVTPAVAAMSLTTLWAWDSVQANWYFYAPSLDNSAGLGAYIASKGYLDFGTKTLATGMGFWVNHP